MGQKDENPLFRLRRPVQKMIGKWEKLPVLRLPPDATDVESATLRYMLYIMLPAWFIPGILDYIMHRRTNIAHTSGTRESIIHAMMMTEVGLPTIMALLLEINPLTLLLMYTASLTHEATAFWDVSTAVNLRREVKPNEQHIHSFLEVMPFMAVAFVSVLHSDQLRLLLSLNKNTPAKAERWKLRLKRPHLPTAYLATIFTAIALLVVLPYTEELVRCARAKHNNYK